MKNIHKTILIAYVSVVLVGIAICGVRMIFI